jgi:Tfp pilus assembly protein PilE
MVVVAVLAILATIVIPTYDSMMRSIRRADGRAALGALATAQERYFSIYRRYVNDFSLLASQAGLDTSMVHLKDGSWYSPKDRYTLAIAAGPTGALNTSFTATATPTAPDKNCTAMSLNSLGVRTGTATAGEELKCW